MKCEGELSPGAVAFVCRLFAGGHPGVGCSPLLRLDGGAAGGGDPGVVGFLTLDVAAALRVLRLDGVCPALMNNPRLILVTHHRGDTLHNRNRRRRSL